jgi:hypothetical protein
MVPHVCVMCVCTHIHIHTFMYTLKLSTFHILRKAHVNVSGYYQLRGGGLQGTCNRYNQGTALVALVPSLHYYAGTLLQCPSCLFTKSSRSVGERKPPA